MQALDEKERFEGIGGNKKKMSKSKTHIHMRERDWEGVANTNRGGDDH